MAALPISDAQASTTPSVRLADIDRLSVFDGRLTAGATRFVLGVIGTSGDCQIPPKPAPGVWEKDYDSALPFDCVDSDSIGVVVSKPDMTPLVPPPKPDCPFVSNLVPAYDQVDAETQLFSEEGACVEYVDEMSFEAEEIAEVEML
eukprot:tig00000711_g3382.t1